MANNQDANKIAEEFLKEVSKNVVQDISLWEVTPDRGQSSITHKTVADKDIWDNADNEVKKNIAKIAVADQSIWNKADKEVKKDIKDKIAEIIKDKNNIEILKNACFEAKEEIIFGDRGIKFFQEIYFGSPGVGKSYQINKKIEEFEWQKRVTFYPDYSYSDFMVKIVPDVKSGNVTYNTITGDFLESLAQAYLYLSEYIDKFLNGEKPESIENCALVIEELNRANAPAVFGKVFQLLDRDHYGFSEYKISLSETEYEVLQKKLGDKLDTINKFMNLAQERKEVRIPCNLSIFATINTSDDSIYFLDSAFKRRWDWIHVDIEGKVQDKETSTIIVDNWGNWKNLVNNLNKKLKEKKDEVRNIEDKLVGYYFLKPDKEGKIREEDIKNKLMFYIWDTVFPNNKEIIKELFLEKESEVPVTFSDFTGQFHKFLDSLK